MFTPTKTGIESQGEENQSVKTEEPWRTFTLRKYSSVNKLKEVKRINGYPVYYESLIFLVLLTAANVQSRKLIVIERPTRSFFICKFPFRRNKVGKSIRKNRFFKKAWHG